MLLEQLLENNRHFRRQYQAPPPATARLLVVADSDAALSGLLEPALGLEPGQVVQVRLAAAWAGTNGEEMLRSVLLAVHLDKIEAVLVVGSADSPYAPADELRLRRSLQHSGLAGQLLDGGKQLLQRLNSPGDIRQAVSATTRLLRERLLPPGIPVHALLLDGNNGALEVLEVPESESSPAPGEQAAPKEDTAPPAGPDEIPLPELPPLELPEIPPLDLDALLAVPAGDTASPPPQPRSVYGRHGSQAGPVTFEELASMNALPPRPGEQIPEMKARQLQIEGITFEVPQPVEVADTGLEKPRSQSPPPQPGPVASPPPPAATVQPSVPASSSVQAQPARKRPRPARRRPEQPETTPLVTARSAPTTTAQVPLRERVIDFDDKEKTPVPARRNIRVDLDAGYLEVEGTDLPIDPSLQKALLKLKRFLARELDRRTLELLARSVRHKSLEGMAVGELLKLVITPVLRLGKKRYAVINDLLTIKEQLPRMEARLASTLLENVLAP